MFDLDKLNSLTKYPSIPTYHEITKKNLLTEEILVRFPADADLIGTEKVDGTNGRIILLPDGTYFIGSREDLIYFSGDLIHNPHQDPILNAIIKNLVPVAERALKVWENKFGMNIVIVFAEVFGSNIGPGKVYSNKKQSIRLFDIGFVPAARADGKWGYKELFTFTRDKISSWRQHGGQDFIEEAELWDCAKQIDLLLTPRLPLTPLPTTLTETLGWLRLNITKSMVVMDVDAPGTPEGIVVRTPDRKFIAKLRFEDYEHTLRKLNATEN